MNDPIELLKGCLPLLRGAPQWHSSEISERIEKAIALIEADRRQSAEQCAEDNRPRIDLPGGYYVKGHYELWRDRSNQPNPIDIQVAVACENMRLSPFAIAIVARIEALDQELQRR